MPAQKAASKKRAPKTAASQKQAAPKAAAPKAVSPKAAAPKAAAPKAASPKAAPRGAGAKGALDALPRFHARDRAAWRAWLEDNHASSSGVWLVTDKKSGDPAQRRLDNEAAIEEALCFGWVDSLPRSLDDTRSMLLVTPRKPKSNWSQKNKERAERLIAEGRMAPAGLAAVRLARERGTWDALDDVEALRLPDDLARALDARPPARAHFEAFPRSVKRAILEWIQNARQDETRSKRVEQTATLAQKNLRANQWRQPRTAGDRAP